MELVELSNRRIVEFSGIVMLVELSNHQIVELWHGEVVALMTLWNRQINEWRKGGMVKRVELSNHQKVEWWRCQIVAWSNHRMVE